MALAMANLLNLPIVLITQMESMSVVPVTPRETLQCLPIFVAFDHSGEGYYDAVAHSTSHSVATETQSCSVSSITTNPESCRCGQGARKKESNITSCDNSKKKMQVFSKCERLY